MILDNPVKRGLLAGLVPLLFVCLVSTLSINTSWAANNVVSLMDKQQRYNLKPALRYFEDELGQLNFSDVYNDRLAIPWKRVQGGGPSFGFTRSAFWLYAEIENSSASGQWYLNVDNAQIRELNLYLLVDGAIQKVYQTGDSFEFNGRPLESRTFLFPLDMYQDKKVELLLRVRGPYPLRVPVSIIERTHYFQSAVQTELAYGLFFGFLVAMAVYNFFIFMATREFSYLFYVLFTLSTTSFLSAELGFSFQYLWPSSIHWQHKAVGVLGCLTMLFAGVFSSEFLHLRQRQRVFYYLLLLGVIYSAVMFVAGWFVEPYYLQQMNTYVTLLGVVVILFAGYKVWRGGHSEAGYFVVAWAFFLVGVIGMIAHRQGLVTNVFLGQHSMEVGAALELVLLSFALAEKLSRQRAERVNLDRQARNERAKVLADKETALERERVGNERLASNVKKRTERLHQALAELSLVNHKLEEMSTVDAVTGLKNQESFVQRLRAEWERAYRDQTPLALLLVEIERFDTIGDSYGYVAADESLKVVGDMLRSAVTRPADLLARVEVALFGAVLPNTDREGVDHLIKEVNQKLKAEPINLGVCSISVSVSCAGSVVIPQVSGESNLLFDEARNQLKE